MKEPISLTTLDEASKHGLSPPKICRIDYGATDYMTGNSNIFSSFQSHKTLSLIKVADGYTCNIVRYGTIKLTSFITVLSVLVLLKLAFNLYVSVNLQKTSIVISFSSHIIVCFVILQQIKLLVKYILMMVPISLMNMNLNLFRVSV